MNIRHTFSFVLFFVTINTAFSQTQPSTFEVIPFGIKGGSDESNLSSYAIAVLGTKDYVCLDAGTLHAGIKKAIALGSFKGSVDEILKNNIKGYLISHPHLDHVAGLIINSPDDLPKPIYGTPFCIDVIKSNYFTTKSWINFANEGDKPTLNKYHYVTLSTTEEIPLEQTQMNVKAFILSHGNPYQSTAFLINYKTDYILYLGDTGADANEKTDNLKDLWKAIAPLVQSKKLKGIFIEVSFANEQPDKLLFGHLTPKLLMGEMNVLNNLSDHALKNFPIVITHRKPGGTREEDIKKQLMDANSLQLKLIFPEQGRLLKL